MPTQPSSLENFTISLHLCWITFPVLQRQLRDPRKLTDVMGDQSQLMGEGDRPNLQIISPNWCTVGFQLRSNNAKGHSGAIIKRKRNKLPKNSPL